MLITDQHTSLFLCHSLPFPAILSLPPPSPLVVWQAGGAAPLFSRPFSSVSSVASRFVLERPIAGLVARRPRVRPTSRPYDPKPRGNLPFALFRSPFCLLKIHRHASPTFASLGRLLLTTNQNRRASCPRETDPPLFAQHVLPI